METTVWLFQKNYSLGAIHKLNNANFIYDPLTLFYYHLFHVPSGIQTPDLLSGKLEHRTLCFAAPLTHAAPYLNFSNLFATA